MKIGHRGARGYEPENTILSFIDAIERGAEALEFDVRFSGSRKSDRKREIVVFHDPALERTTNGRGLVCNFSYDELRRLDAGKCERIPLLDQVFGVLGKGNIFDWKPLFNVELKEKAMVGDVLRLIQRYNLVDSVIVSAFDMNENESGDTSTWNDLFVMKVREPKLRIALLVERAENLQRAFEVRATWNEKVYAINPSKDIVTREMVSRAHASGMKVFVWTVNEPDDIARIKAMGVDGIFSDYPDRL
ncbi:MAG: glycerophosphodiester phosphodiesterase family protein [bacterium]|nr:glycerophosphodiester phosphodiesterase family protein [bacterium]